MPLRTFQQFQKECAAGGFDIELGIHLRNLIAFATNQSRFLTVGNLPVEKLTTAWNECVPGMEFAINFVTNNCGIDSPSLLSSPYLIVALASYGHKHNYRIDAEEERALRKWAMLANAKGRYSRGSSETLLDQDLAIIRDGGKSQELLDRLRLQVGRLEIMPGELEGRNQRSALFKSMFLAFPRWRSKRLAKQCNNCFGPPWGYP